MQSFQPLFFRVPSQRKAIRDHPNFGCICFGVALLIQPALEGMASKLPPEKAKVQIADI